LSAGNDPLLLADLRLIHRLNSGRSTWRPR